MRILIVDDSKFTRALLRREFEDGDEVLEASDGREALELLRTAQRPDAILIDLLMPRMNGFELVAALREGKYDGPIVVCTANTQPSVERRVRELGATEFVQKPELLVPGRAKELVASLTAGDRRNVTRPRSATRVEERRNAATVAMETVTSVLNGFTLLPAQVSRSSMPDSPSAGTTTGSLATIQVNVSLGGGLDSSATLSLPGADLLQAALGPTGEASEGHSTPEAAALEVGRLLVSTFTAGLRENLRKTIEFGEVRCDPAPTAEGDASDDSTSGLLTIEVAFSLSNAHEIGSMSITLERSDLEDLFTPTKPPEECVPKA